MSILDEASSFVVENTIRKNSDSTFEKTPALGGRKVFAKPFRLVFKKTKDQTITWIEVKTLDGLKTVTKRISEGELLPVNENATLDRQLWGLLAEYIGFLRFAGDFGEFNAGIQPIGAEQAQLGDDMAEIFGGVEPALSALSEIREKIVSQEPVEPTSVEGENFVKKDGVNLTPVGEEKLVELVTGAKGKNIKIAQEAGNAEILVSETEPPSVEEEIEAAIQDTRPEEDLRTVTGPKAEEIARRIEDAARGEID